MKYLPGRMNLVELKRSKIKAQQRWKRAQTNHFQVLRKFGSIAERADDHRMLQKSYITARERNTYNDWYSRISVHDTKMVKYLKALPRRRKLSPIRSKRVPRRRILHAFQVSDHGSKFSLSVCFWNSYCWFSFLFHNGALVRVYCRERM